MSTAITRESPRHKEAYREFLRLGVTRSYDALHDRLLAMWGEEITPSVDTLKRWSTVFGWVARIIDDDEVINRRALERIRDRMATESEQRRQKRLQISDIQMNAVLRALVTRDTNPQSDTYQQTVPRDILKLDPGQLRAINDTFKTASDAQRLDGGEATARIAAENADQVAGREMRIMADESVLVMQEFLGLEVADDGAYDTVEGEAVVVDADEIALDGEE